MPFPKKKAKKPSFNIPGNRDFGMMPPPDISGAASGRALPPIRSAKAAPPPFKKPKKPKGFPSGGL